MSQLITDRWFTIPDKALKHPTQIELRNDLLSKKYLQYIIAAGRRSYKTERFGKRYAIQRLNEGSNQTIFVGAPTRIQAEGIYWKDLKQMCPPFLVKKISESKLQIDAVNGNKIQVIGLKEFKRIQGQICHVAIFGEYQECDVDVWNETFEPMLNDTGGIAVKEGRPLGKNHFYDDYKKGLSGLDGMMSYHWTSEEILSEEQIERAKRNLGEADYAREYLASFDTGSSSPYYAYNELNHSEHQLIRSLPIIVSCDFNATERPMSWNIGQRLIEGIEDKTHWTKTLSYPFTNTEVMCGILDDYFLKDKHNYPEHLIFYGDYAGRAIKSNSSYSDWQIIENYFRNKCKFEKRIKPCKSIRDSIAATNAQLCNSYGQMKQFVNVKECKALVTDWNKCEWKDNSKELKDNDVLRGHACRAVDYYNDYEHSTRGKTTNKTIHTV